VNSTPHLFQFFNKKDNFKVKYRWPY